MVEDINSHIIGITEFWAKNIADAEIGLRGYAIFSRDRMERRRGGFILHIK